MRAARLRATRDELVDIVFAGAAAAIGVVGFRTSFGGHEELTVGLPAVALGLLVGSVLARLRPQLLVGASAVFASLFVLGPAVGLRVGAAALVIPTPVSAAALVDGAVNGWARLLTTVPPAGEAGNLLAIPYLVGFLGALLAVNAARVLRGAWCIVPPVGALATSVLFGVGQPAALLLQGAVFGALLVGWLVLRARRTAVPVVPGHRRPRGLVAAALLVAAAAVGAIVGPALPLADARPRFVLRDRVKPPFDASQYPSPLARFRDFHGQQPIEADLFTVSGLPKNTPIRFAVMDSYDGHVWRASPPGTASGGTYERVGPAIPGKGVGRRVEVEFMMKALSSSDSVWIPTVGSPTGISFAGEEADALNDELRFNRVTQSAASPVVLRPGDRWTVRTRLPSTLDPERLKELPIASGVGIPEVIPPNDRVAERVAKWTEGARSPYEKVSSIEHHLIDIGAYNDGSKDEPIASGHSLGRLLPFLQADQPQGNGEQYAAAVAYLAQSIGIPARVVLDFMPPSGSGTVHVKAKDARATVEVALEGAGWVAAPNPTPDESDKPTPQVQQREQQPQAEVQPPPPTPPKPPSVLPDNVQLTRKPRAPEQPTGWLPRLLVVFRFAGYALVGGLVISGPGLVVAAIKRRRRTRRRTVGTAADRVLGAWQEITDVARDHGAPVPVKATRVEVGRFVPAISAAGLPDTVDALLFGASSPSPHDAARVWAQVDEAESALLDGRSRLDRLRGVLSLTSMR